MSLMMSNKRYRETIKLVVKDMYDLVDRQEQPLTVDIFYDDGEYICTYDMVELKAEYLSVLAYESLLKIKKFNNKILSLNVN